MFPGFTAADFGSYEPHKWRSNVFNRERMEVKQRLLQLAREVGGGLVASDGSPLFIEASVEHPALWNHKQVDSQSVYFSRSEAARKDLDGIIDRQRPISSLLDDPTPQRNHIFLAITLTADGLDLSLKLHPDARVDRQNLERKIEDHFERERLLDLLLGLPVEFSIGITPEKRPIRGAAPALDAEGLRAIVHALPRASGSGPPPLGPPGQAPVAHLLYVGESRARAALLEMTPAATVEWVGRGLGLLLPIYRFIAWSRDNDYVSMRQVLDKERTVKRQKGFMRGEKVRVIRGVFASKNGVIQEVDAKGGLKVLVGKMVVKLDVEDVEKP